MRVVKQGGEKIKKKKKIQHARLFVRMLRGVPDATSLFFSSVMLQGPFVIPRHP